jgi:hypothetical protein
MLIEGDRRIYTHHHQPAPPPPPPPPPRQSDGVDPVKQEPAYFAPPPPPPPLPPSEPPHQALDRIEALPRPTSAGIPRGLPPEDRQAIMDERNADYHRQRLAMAEAALKNPQAPRPEDFRGGGLNAATASHEYQEARAAHSAALSELEARARDSRQALYPPKPLDAQQNLTLAALGVKLSKQPTPDELSAAHELLAQLPQELTSSLFNVGRELTLSKEVKLAPGTTATISGSTELSPERTGADFQELHKLTVELEVTSGLDLSKGQMKGWQKQGLELLERVDNLSPAARNLIKAAKVAGPVEFEYQRQAGGRLTVESKVTPEQARQIDEGKLAVPNPFDPASMPTGTTMMIKGQALESTSIALGYKVFQTESGVTDLKGFGIGVEKLDGNVMRVTTGPVATVENEVFVGVGTGDFKVGLGGETTLEGTHMRTAEFDLNSPEGNRAYQEFLRTGAVPNSFTPGVTRAGQIDTMSIDSKGFAELKLGGFGKRWEFGSSEGERRTVTWDDGRVDESLYLRNNDRGLQIDRKFDSEGGLLPGTEYKIIGTDTHPVCAGYAEVAFSNRDTNRTPKGEQDVQITMSTSDLLELRRRAQSFVSAHPGGMPDLVDQLAKSEDADEVAMWLVRYGVDGSMNAVFEDLVGLKASTDHRAPLPGKFEMRG